MTKSGLGVLALLAVLSVPTVAAAQGGAASDAKLKPGIALIKSHDYDKAVTSLSKVYASTKDARALYWIARAHQENGHNADALRTFKQFMKESSLGATDPKSVEVLGHVQTLSMQVGFVTVTATEGATITVDDVEIGKAPLADVVDGARRTSSRRRCSSPASIGWPTRRTTTAWCSCSPAPTTGSSRSSIARTTGRCRTRFRTCRRPTRSTGRST